MLLLWDVLSGYIEINEPIGKYKWWSEVTNETLSSPILAVTT